MEPTTTYNEGGVNGLGKGFVDTNSRSFKDLKQAINRDYHTRTPEEKLTASINAIRYQLQAYIADDTRGDTLSAGYFIVKVVDTLGITNKRLAEYLIVDYDGLTRVLRGEQSVTADLALKLGKLLEVQPIDWMTIDSKNALAKCSVMQTNDKHYSLAELTE